MPNITKKSGLLYYTSLLKEAIAYMITGRIDGELSEKSNNAVQNKVVKAALDEKTTLEEVAVKVSGGAWLPVSVGKNAGGETVKLAVAQGMLTTASGQGAHAEGVNTTASGSFSHAEGQNTTASHRAAHAEGNATVASRPYVHAEGVRNYDLTTAISMIGVGETDSPKNARVIIYDREASNNGHMYLLDVGGYEGTDIEDGMKSVQEVIADHEDRITKFSKDVDLTPYSTTEEIKQSLSTGEWLPLQGGEGEKSVVMGNQTTASGQYAFASGLSTTASGLYSHAEGVFCVASGNYSHAEGSNAKPKGEYSHAEGERTEIASQGGHSEGVCTFLNDNEDVIHHVGVGTYNDKLSTDVILRKYGDAKNGYQYMIGVGGYNGKEITSSTMSIQEVFASVGEKMLELQIRASTNERNITTANTSISNNATAIGATNERVAAIDSRVGTIEGARMDIITTGGSSDEPVPVWVNSTRQDITEKKRMQTYIGFTNIDVSGDINANTSAAAALRDRRSWISSIRLRNFSGTKFARAFMCCGGIQKLDTSTWDMSHVTTLRSTFYACVQLEDLDVSHWDTHSVTDLGYAFYMCQKIKTFDMRSWDTSAVTSMDGVFCACTSLTELSLAGWEVSQVQKMDSMFNNCGMLRKLDLRYWELSACSNMDWFLNGCGAIEELYISEGFGRVLNAVGTIDLSGLTKWTGDSVQTLLTLFDRTAHYSEGFRTITLRLSSQTKAALGTSGIQTLTSRGYTIA